MNPAPESQHAPPLRFVEERMGERLYCFDSGTVTISARGDEPLTPDGELALMADALAAISARPGAAS